MANTRRLQPILLGSLALLCIAPRGSVMIPVLAQTVPGTLAPAPDVEQPTREPTPEELRLLNQVSSLCTADRFTEALTVALSLSDPFWRDGAVATVALGQAQKGDYAGAIRTVPVIRNLVRQSATLNIIATLQYTNPRVPRTDVGKTLAKATAIAGKISPVLKRDKVLSTLASTYARCNNVKAAQTLVRRIQTPAQKVEPLIYIASQQAANRDFPAARSSARLAYAILADTGASYGRNVSLRRIIETQFTCGDLGDALNSGLLMDDPSYRSNTLAQIGYRIAHAGDRSIAYKVIQLARESFNGISDGYYRDVVRAEIIIALVEAGHIDEARKIYPEIYDPQQKERARKALERKS